MVSPKYGLKEVLINTDKLRLFNEWNNIHISYSSRIKGFYANCDRTLEGKRIQAKLHRIITDCPRDKKVDHIDHNGLNNLDNNLRIATDSENSQNVIGAPSSNKTSGILCITKFISKHNIYWRSRLRLRINGKSVNVYSKLYPYTEEGLRIASQEIKQARKELFPFSQEAYKE